MQFFHPVTFYLFMDVVMVLKVVPVEVLLLLLCLTSFIGFEEEKAGVFTFYHVARIS